MTEIKIELQELKILICDDSLTNSLILEKLLNHEGYNNVKLTTDPTQVCKLIGRSSFDLLMLDIEMPQMNGFEVMEALKNSSEATNLPPILVLTANESKEVRNKALEAGAQDFLTKPFDQTEVILRVKNLLKVRQSNLYQTHYSADLERQVALRTAELEKASDALISSMAKAAELRDKATSKHVLRVGGYAELLATLVGLPYDIAYLIGKAAPLHDVGKIGIPDHILLKEGPLTSDERSIMNSHATLGAELLSGYDSAVITMASTIALTHHEKWDGTGYPRQLKAGSIPIEGQITNLCDVFDALTTKRPYKDAWSVEKAVDWIKEQSGAQFSPELVNLFINNLGKFIEIKNKYKDEELF